MRCSCSGRIRVGRCEKAFKLRLTREVGLGRLGGMWTCDSTRFRLSVHATVRLLPVDAHPASVLPHLRPFVRGTLFVALCLATFSCNVGAGIVPRGGAPTGEVAGSVTQVQSKVEPTESLTPTERHWADQMNECVGLTEFDILVVRRSTVVDVIALSGENLQVMQNLQVWVVAFVTRAGIDEFNSSAARLIAASMRAADSASGAEMPSNATAASSARPISGAATTGYCAFGITEKSSMTMIDIIPPATADAFMADFKKLPRTP